MHIVASVQARLGSSRLPGKVLYHLGNRRLLQWVIDRPKTADTIDETVATIGDQPENDAVTEFCDRAGISYNVGPEDNLLLRHLNVAEQTNCDLLVRINADCPFVPPTEIDRVVEAHISNDAEYTTNFTGRVPHGINVDVIDTAVLEELNSGNETHPVLPLRENPDCWNVKFTDDPAWVPFADVGMTVDTPTDYWNLCDAVDSVGSDAIKIARWLDSR